MMRLIYLFTFFFLTHCTSLYAQQSLNDTLKLKEVIVTGVKPPAKDRSAVPMQSVSRKELDRVTGNSAADAIKNFSGITLKDYGGIGGLKTVMVRSLGANHTGVFMDGVQLSDAATGQIDLGKINTDNASDVTLVISQPVDLCLPARYYASASVISINTLEPDFKTKPFRVKAGFKTGSFGVLSPSISVQNKWSSKSYSDISGYYTRANGEYPFYLKYGSSMDTTGRRLNSDVETLNFNAAVISALRNNLKLSVRLYYYGSERGLPGAVVYYNPYAAQRLWNRDFFSNIQLKSDPKQNHQWLTNVKFSQNWLRYLDPEYLNTEGKLDNRYLQHEYYISQAFTCMPFDSIHFSLASDLIINTLDANLYQYARPTRYSSLTAFAFRYFKTRLEINGNILLTLVREKTAEGEAANPKNKLTPSISFGYKISNSPNIRIRFLYKDVFRMPTFNDLYYTLVGNNNLRPEYAKQYNFGITGYGNRGFIEYMSFKADAFYNQVKDKIVAVPTKNLFVWSMRNIGKVTIRGIELQAQAQTRSVKGFRFSLSCNYTYQEATDATDETSATYNQQIPYIPFESFTTLGTVGYKSVSLSYNAMFTGYRYVLGENIYANMLPSWWNSDVSATYEVKVKSSLLKFKGEISNLFNKQYEVIRSFPMPGRSYSIALNLTL